MGSGMPKSLFRPGTGDEAFVPRMSDPSAGSDGGEGVSRRWQRFIDLGDGERVPCVPDWCADLDEDEGEGVSTR